MAKVEDPHAPSPDPRGSRKLLGKLLRLGRRFRGQDRDLLILLRREPAAGWRLFLDRYSGHLLAMVRDFGFDHDESMDRFVYICERLAAEDCRRLRQIKHLGDRGELLPWLRQVVRHLLINWAWSTEGRPRLMKSIEALPPFAQEVFRLHYWEGLTASEVAERLRASGEEAPVMEIYGALDQVHGALDAQGRWRLLSKLRSRQSPRSFDSESGARQPIPSPEKDPESLALEAETQRQVKDALTVLPTRDQLLIRLRYDEWLEPSEVAAMLGESPATIRRRLHRAMVRLRSSMASPAPKTRPDEPAEKSRAERQNAAKSEPARKIS